MRTRVRDNAENNTHAHTRTGQPQTRRYTVTTFGTTIVFENSTHDCYFGVFLCSPELCRRCRAFSRRGAPTAVRRADLLHTVVVRSRDTRRSERFANTDPVAGIARDPRCHRYVRFYHPRDVVPGYSPRTKIRAVSPDSVYWSFHRTVTVSPTRSCRGHSDTAVR